MQMEDYEIKHIEVMRRLAPECMVLLKKNGDFPLEQKGRIALYGSDARMTVKGGTGSGDVNVRRYTTIEQGLERAGFTITTKDWLEAFAACHKKPGWSIQKRAKELQVSAMFLAMGAVMPQPEYELPLDGDGDAAVYVLSRIS